MLEVQESSLVTSCNANWPSAIGRIPLPKDDVSGKDVPLINSLLYSSLEFIKDQRTLGIPVENVAYTYPLINKLSESQVASGSFEANQTQDEYSGKRVEQSQLRLVCTTDTSQLKIVINYLRSKLAKQLC